MKKLFVLFFLLASFASQAQLVQMPSSSFIIPVNDTFAVGSKSYTRRIEVVEMRYNIVDKLITVTGIMHFFHLDSTNKEEKNSLAARPYAFPITASNKVYCDAQTGETLCAVSDEYVDAAKTQLNPKLVGKQYMLQYDWFFNVAQNVPVKVNEIIGLFMVKTLQKGELN